MNCIIQFFIEGLRRGKYIPLMQSKRAIQYFSTHMQFCKSSFYWWNSMSSTALTSISWKGPFFFSQCLERPTQIFLHFAKDPPLTFELRQDATVRILSWCVESRLLARRRGCGWWFWIKIHFIGFIANLSRIIAYHLRANQIENIENVDKDMDVPGTCSAPNWTRA